MSARTCLKCVLPASILLDDCRMHGWPHVQEAAAITAPAFKEAAPTTTADDEPWKPGQPSDAEWKGEWWTTFGDDKLNKLEAQLESANQTVQEAEANFRAARSQIGVARSYEAPTIGAGPRVNSVRNSDNQPYFSHTLDNNGLGNFTLPVDLSYEIDLWGRIRRGVTSAREQAQANDADLENAKLSLHAELAMDYFGLRTDDAQSRLLDDTVEAYENALQLRRSCHTCDWAYLATLSWRK